MTTAHGAGPQTAKLPLILAAVAVVAVVVPAGLLRGAFATPVVGLPHTGSLERWWLPLVRPIHDLTAAGPVALLVVAATLAPAPPHRPRSTPASPLPSPPVPV